MANNITSAREMRGLTQSGLAAAVKVSPQQVGNWEQGFRNPSGENLAKLAEALRVDKAWLAGCPSKIPVLDHIEQKTYHMPVIKSTEIDNYGTLYIVWCDDCRPLPVIVGDGLTLVPRDWEAARAIEPEEIQDYDWIAPDGSQCVMLDGLPRAGWWV